MARRIPGEFVPCDVNLVSDPAVMRAGALAELVFRRATEYAKRNDRDGDIYPMDIGLICNGIPGRPAQHVAALLREGLWETSGEGWQIRSFLKWNLSQAEQREEKDRKRLGAHRSNHKQGQHDTSPHPECPDCGGRK